MTWLAGLDGCRGGWLCVLEELESGLRRVELLPDFASLLRLRPEPGVIAIDIPIGLPDTGRRDCEREARRQLGRGGSSRVFPVPTRPLLAAQSYPEANDLSRRLEGRGFTRQTFGILPRIREVDRALTRALESRVHEVHPELCFAAMSGGGALPPKRSERGQRERIALLRREFDAFDPGSPSFPRARAAPDDVLDAYAVLWTARRIARHRARPLPDPPPRDSRGWRMAIWT